jgi:hypothetical protein
MNGSNILKSHDFHASSDGEGLKRPAKPRTASPEYPNLPLAESQDQI